MDKRKKRHGGGVGEVKKVKRERQAEQSDEIQFSNSILFLKRFSLASLLFWCNKVEVLNHFE